MNIEKHISGAIHDMMEDKERHEEAVEAAKSLAKSSRNICPVSVYPACQQKEQDDLEKQYDIAPGCGYYRRRYNDFLHRYPGQTPPSYYLSYGEKYCNKFTRETYDTLSPKGKAWFEGVKCGLQDGIEKVLQDTSISYLELLDKPFSDAAFEMHAPVYLKNKLAFLPFSDMLSIGTTPWQEFIPGLGNNVSGTWGQAFEVLPDIAEERPGVWANEVYEDYLETGGKDFVE